MILCGCWCCHLNKESKGVQKLVNQFLTQAQQEAGEDTGPGTSLHPWGEHQLPLPTFSAQEFCLDHGAYSVHAHEPSSARVERISIVLNMGQC